MANFYQKIRYIFLILLFPLGGYGQSISGGTGNWNSTTVNAPWTTGTVPPAGNTVTTNHNITVTANATCAALDIQSNTITVNTGITLTINGNLIVNGTLTINGTGVVTVAGGVSGNGIITFVANGTLNIAGDNTFAGTFNAGTGTVNYNQGSAGQNIPALNYNNLIFSNFNKTLANTGTIGISGAFTPGTATGHTITGSTINFNSTAAQNIPAIPTTGYNNLTISNNSTKTLAGAVVVNGNFVINTPAIFNISNQDFRVNGTSSISGTLNDGSIAGTNIFVGNVTINVGGVWSIAVAESFEFRNGLTHNGTTFTSGTGTYNFTNSDGNITTTSQNIAGSSVMTFSGNVFIDIDTRLININSNLSGITIVGTLNGASSSTSTFENQTLINYQSTTQPMVTGILDADFNGNTFNYSATAGTQTTHHTNYWNLRTSGGGTKTWNPNNSGTLRTINGNLDITAGTLVLANTNNATNSQMDILGNLTLSGTAILNLSQANTPAGNNGFSTVNLRGNFSQAAGTSVQRTGTGTLSANSVIIFNGTLAQSMTGGGATTGGIFEINNINGVSLTSNVNVFTLRLTNGVLNTGTNILTVNNTASTGILAGTSFSITNCVEGILTRTFPNGATTGTYSYPLKKGSNYYGTIDVINPTTTAANTTARFEIFNANTGGSVGTGLNSLLNNNMYWETITNGSLSSLIKLASTGMSATDKIGRSNSLTGSYVSVGGIVSGNEISTSNRFTYNNPSNFFAIGTQGNLNGTYQVGSSCEFLKLTDVAFALNENLVTGNVIFEFCDSYDGTTGETFPIIFNQFTTQGGNPYTVTIRPSTSITTAKTTSGGEIRFNGVDRLTFDGRPGGIGDMTNINWTISSTSTTTSTLNFINDATDNLIQYCNIEGGVTNAGGTNSVITFGSGTSSGNDINNIQYCEIRNASGASPLRAISSVGLSAAVSNDNINIANNRIYNFFAASASFNVIDINSNTTNLTFQDNSIYQTFDFVGGASNPSYMSVVRLNNTNVQNITIANNFFGGRLPNCGGTAFVFRNPSNRLRVRWIESTSTNAIISGNTIANIEMQSYTTLAQATSEESFRGILISAGSATLTNNTIGSSTSATSINIVKQANNTAATSVPVFGIEYSGTSGSVSGNTIAGIRFTFNAASTRGFDFAGVRIFSNANNINFQNNIIGSSQANSILMNDANSINTMIGIRIETNQSPIIQNNTIQNLTNPTNTAANNLVGINNAGSSAIVRNNTITNLAVQATTANAFIIGINNTSGTLQFGSSAGQENTISNLSNTSTGIGASIIGILNGVNNVNINYNIVENITSTTNTIVGISNLSPASSPSITNNIVRNITNNANTATSTLVGISNALNGGTPTIANNQIYNLASASTAPSGTDLLAVAGIINNPNGAGTATIRDNIIYSIRSTTTGTANGTNAAGIFVTGGGSTNILRNRIYDITNVSGGTSPVAAGIIARNIGGSNYIYNNMISLGLNTDGSANTNDMLLVGIWQNFDDNQIMHNYFNSIQIAGSSTGTYDTFGFLRGDYDGTTTITTPIRIINNIFQNLRTGNGNHFTIGNLDSPNNWTGNLTDCQGNNKFVDYNALYSADASNVGNWLGSAYSFANWQTNATSDFKSVDLTNSINFASPQTADLHISNTDIAVNAKGLFITTPLVINTDYDNITRRGPDIGADEFDNVFTYSGTDGNWNNAATWDLNAVPTHADVVRVTGNVFILTGQVGYFYQLEITNTGNLELQGTGQVYGCWSDGNLENNGQMSLSSTAQVLLAGSIEDNANYDALEGTTILNQDEITPLTNCITKAYILDFNNNTNVSDIISTVHTSFFNVNIINNGLTNLQSTGQDISINNLLSITGASGQIIIGDNILTLNGTFADGIGNGTITGSNTSDMLIGGTTGGSVGDLKFTTGSRILDNLTMNRTGSLGRAGLGTDLTYVGTLTLTQGRIITTATNLLTADINADVVGGNSNSYVEGPMAKNSNSTDTFTFPVGKNFLLSRIGFTPETANAVTFRAEYFQIAPQTIDTEFDSSLDHISFLEYWLLDRTAGNTNAFVTLHWTWYSKVSPRLGQDGIDDWRELRVARWGNNATPLDGAWWNDEGSNAGGSGAYSAGTVTSDLVTEFSPFTLATTTEWNPLPSNISSFTAQAQNNKQVLVKWTTAYEQNLSTFEVERSLDNKNFQVVGKVKAFGNSTTNRNYNFLDMKPLLGTSYYRLRQIDQNTNQQLTESRSVEIQGVLNEKLKLYPNPVTETITWEVTTSQKTQAKFEIKSIKGETILSKDLEMNVGQNKFNFDVKSLKSGVYVIEILYQSEKIVKKIIKK
jgi:hypothetical protein